MSPSIKKENKINNKTARLPKIDDPTKKGLIVQALLHDEWIETGDFPWKTGARQKPAIKIRGGTKKNFDLFADQLNELEEEKILISKIDESKRWKIKPTIYFLNKENWKTVLFIYENIAEGQDYILNNEWAFELLYNQKIEGISDEHVKSDIRKMLKLSPMFYRFALKFSNLKEMAQLYYDYSILYKLEILNPLKPELEKKLIEQKQKYAFHELFLFCVFCDRIKNPDNSAAFNFLREIKNRSAMEEGSNLGLFNLNLEFRTIQAIFELEEKNPRQIKKIKGLVEKCNNLIYHLQNVETTDKKFGDLIKTYIEIDDILGIIKTINEQYFTK